MVDKLRTVKETRAILKNIIYGELERLPGILEGMEPKERINIIIKLLPYALPKNDTADFTYGEPQDFSWD